MKKFLIIAVPVCAFFLMLGCEPPRQEKGVEENKATTPRIKIEAYKVIEGEVHGRVNTSGKTEGVREATVSAEAAGTIEKVNFVLGEYVKQGSPLLELDDAAAKAAYDQARIQYEVAKTAFETTEKLYNEGNASEVEYKSAKAQMELALSGREQSRVMYEGYSLQAPISGLIVSRHVREGELLNPGMPVTKITDISSLKVVCYVGEDAVTRIDKSNPVDVRVAAFPEQVFRGHIAAIGAGVDDMAGGYAVEVVFRNTKDRAIKSGMMTNVTIIVNRMERVPLVRQSCIVTENLKDYVFKVSNGKTARVPVTVGRQKDQYKEILSGINVGDVVAGSKLEELKDGMEVDVYIEQP